MQTGERESSVHRSIRSDVDAPEFAAFDLNPLAHFNGEEHVALDTEAQRLARVDVLILREIEVAIDRAEFEERRRELI